MRHSLQLSTLALAGALTLAACGGGSDNATVAPSGQASTTVTTAVFPTTTVAPIPTTAPAAAPPTMPPPTTAPAVVKVPANTATSAELVAAFTAAGISNPANWAKEVIEYRPYPANDPGLAKLRQNLVKYNPGPGIVDAIVATLSV